jgi:hypothetical protein
METLEKKAKGQKKDKKAKNQSPVTTGRLMKSGNFRKGERKAKLLGQLTEVIGADSIYELYSDNNFLGTKQVMLKGWFAENDPDTDQPDYKIICSADISKELRSAETEEEFLDILDSLENADCYVSTVQSTSRNGEKLFDSKGEPLMEDIYSIEFANSNADMSATRRTATGVAKEVKKVKKAFSITEAISGQY